MCLMTYRCSGVRPSLFFKYMTLRIPIQIAGVNIKILLTFFLGLLIIGRAVSVSAASNEIVVIVNKNYPVSNATLEEIKKIYWGEKQYEEGFKITPIDQNGTFLIRKKFVKHVLDTTMEYYIRHWLEKVFQDGSIPPVVKAGSQEVINAVIQNTGDVGYVWSEDAKGKAGIKIILTIKVD